MTAAADTAVPSTWHSRTEADLTAQRLEAMGRFHEARRAAERGAQVATRSRELRMDTARRLEVLRREHAALVERAHEQLRLSGEALRAAAVRRVVLAHHNEWFATTLTRGLEEQGLTVVARLDNGADAVGLVVAEQPDLLLVEDTLAMLPGEQVVREVRALCPATLVAAQVAYGDRVGALLDAGASTVFTRQVPPAEVAQGLAELVPA